MTILDGMIYRDLLARGVRVRVDVPDWHDKPVRLNGHGYSRVVFVNGSGWIYCGGHKTWEPLD